MKQLLLICALIILACTCDAQILKDTLYWATPAEREMYREAIKKGRSQKAKGILIVVGSAGLAAVGGRLAVEAIKQADREYYNEYISEDVLWKGGTMMFLMGLGGIFGGADMINDGRDNVRKGKICLRVSSTSIGLALNF